MNKFQLYRLLALYAPPELMDACRELDSRAEAAKQVVREVNQDIRDFIHHVESRPEKFNVPTGPKPWDRGPKPTIAMPPTTDLPPNWDKK